MRSVLSTLRRPEYTGNQRCWPCTAVNSALLALVCGILAFTRRRVAAVGVGIGGATAILLRGYFVPYTPRFAPRLVGWLPGDPFHEAGRRESGSIADDTTGEEVLNALTEAGVLVAEGDRLRLDEGFRDRWRGEMESFRTVAPDTLATTAAEYAPGMSAGRVVETGGVFEGEENRWIALEDGSGLIVQETWLSVPVAIAEVAAVRALDPDISADIRVAAAGLLRMFVEECPACGGPIEESTEACCGGYGTAGPDDILVCADCDHRIFTFPSDSGSSTTDRSAGVS